MSDREWTSADQLTEATVTVNPPDGPWPALIALEFGYLATLMSDDCRELAGLLLSAAAEADEATDRYRALPLGGEPPTREETPAP